MTYGEPIHLSDAKKIVAAAQAEAAKNGWNMAIAIVDSGANLVLLEKMDNTQLGSIEICQAKALTAIKFKRATKAFEETVEKGGVNLKILGMPNVIPVEGGEIIVKGDKIIGAIGVSGALSAQDTQVAKAGIAAL
ncbi:MAG: heme-binding protein [Spirochaetes bacterium]|nr:heme-binding protein [Spirochaetota bacterium]